jgi:hypothetical protein
VRYGWTSNAYALCQCGQPVELEVRRDLDGRVLEISRPGDEERQS